MNVFQLLEQPPKVIAMYESVMTLIYEGMDIHMIKVEDITKRAGIGKGTAYEYFKSKDEIIVKALNYNAKKQLKEMFELQEKKERFEDKIKVILQWLQKEYRQFCPMNHLIQIWNGSNEIGQTIQENFVQMEKDSLEYMEFLDHLLQIGIEQGIVKVKSTYQGRTAFISQIVNFIIYLTNSGLYKDTNEETACMVAYENIMKLLTK